MSAEENGPETAAIAPVDPSSPTTSAQPFLAEWKTGKGSMHLVIKAGRESEHKSYAGQDISDKGVKTWASFPTHHDFYNHVKETQEGHRHFYELITETTQVRLWMDVEWRSAMRYGQGDDAENRRAKLEHTLRKALRASFGVEHPCIFFGISTRVNRTKGEIKHSYQVRVPSIVFPRNDKDSALAKWVNRFMEQTGDDDLFRCPVSRKHIIDPAVYSRTRCVRSCFSSKRDDQTNTCLRLMLDYGAAADPGVVVAGELSEFEALLVDASTRKYDGYDVVYVQGNADVRCMGILEQEMALEDYGAVRVGVFADRDSAERAQLAAAIRQGVEKRSRADEDSALGNAAAKRTRTAEDVSGNDVNEDSEGVVGPRKGKGPRDLSLELIDCLAVLGGKHAQSYETWSGVMFAVRNCGNVETCKAAFIEWSKRANSFTDDRDVGEQLENTRPRPRNQTAHALGLASLRRAIRDDPFVVFKGERDYIDGQNMDTLDWSTFLSNVDLTKTSWRCLVRAARAIWPHRRVDVVQDLAAKLRLLEKTVIVERLEEVWDLRHCNDKRFVDSMETYIRQQLLWPELVTKTLPTLLGKCDNRTYVPTAYSSDNAYMLEIELSHVDTDDPCTVKYKVRLMTGEVAASGVNLMERAFMFDPRNPTELLPDYSTDSQMNWAQRVSEIPEIRNNIRYVHEYGWCVYREEEGIWEEMPLKTVHMERYLSTVVRQHFRPLLTFLEFKSGFDNVADCQRVKLLKLLAKFANDDFVAKVLHTISGHDDIFVKDFTEKFNQIPYVLPCTNGLLNLMTMELRPLEREDYVTYKIGCAWNPCADMTEPLNFLRSMFPLNTDDMVGFMVNWLAYCMTGFHNLQVCVFMIGWGSNGKSKLSYVMEQVLGKHCFAHVPYEALCAKSNQPNEELYDARHARMFQVDENPENTSLNLGLIKRLTGEDSLFVRRLYGHNCRIPPGPKLNFAVNAAPRLTSSNDFKELIALARRFLYVNCPAQFVDFAPNSKDQKMIQKLKEEMPRDKFAKCVKQVDTGMDQKLDGMVEGFLRLFAEAATKLIIMKDKGPAFRGLDIPECILNETDRMMYCNPSLKADDFLNTMYEPGVSGDVLLQDMYRAFLQSNSLSEHNFSQSRFEADLTKWIHQQNNTHPNCKHNGLLLKKTRILQGEKKGQIVIKNISVHFSSHS